MKITKKLEGFGIDVGYTIDVSRDEYEALIKALDYAEAFCDENASRDDEKKYRAMREELEAVKKRYLTDEESAPIRNCLCCKNCLPPFQREKGMCRLDKCKFDPA